MRQVYKRAGNNASRGNVMKKAALTLAAVLAGCSVQVNAPAVMHITAQPTINIQQPENYGFLDCDYELKMETWGYQLECRTGLARVTLDHYEWAPESNIYDGNCTERLFVEGRPVNGGEEQKAKWIDYGCNGVDAYMHWTVIQMPAYSYDRLDEMNSPAPDNEDSFEMIKTVILGADEADARWRFRFHVPERCEL